MSDQELGFPSSWKAKEPALAPAGARDQPHAMKAGGGWAAQLRDSVKRTVQVELEGQPAVLMRDPGGGGDASTPPTLLEVVATSVDGGQHWWIQGVTLSGEGRARYFRASTRTHDWPEDLPVWAAKLADDAAADRLQEPEHVCAGCGYPLLWDPLANDRTGGWVHGHHQGQWAHAGVPVERGDGVMVAIANAETTVVVEKTVGEVQVLLRRAGARRIQTTYPETGDDPVGVDFVLMLPEGGSAVYTLPVNAEGVQARLRAEGVAPRHQSREHAARVAWRIAKDWLRAQVALIEAGQATTDQVMLPYQVVGQEEDGSAITVWDRVRATGGPAQLTAGSGKP